MASKRNHCTTAFKYDRSSSEEEDDISNDLKETEELSAQQYEAQHDRSPQTSNNGNNSSTEMNARSSLKSQRRGRTPSKRPCLSKNAMMARENRQRKKEYMEKIELKLHNYQAENQELTNTIQKQNIELKRLNDEVVYLKSVLKNQTVISTLLKSMNDSLGRMNGSQDIHKLNLDQTDSARMSSDVLNWVVNGQTNSSTTNTMSMPSSGAMTRHKLEIPTNNNGRLIQGKQAINNPVKIARKTMPFTTHLSKTQDPSSVESIFEEDDSTTVLKSSPQSSSYCEYIDQGPVGHDNQQPTTPMSAISNSIIDKADTSLSNTDFSQLSTFNVDSLFDNLDDGVDSLKFEQADLFSDETLFHSLDKEPCIGLKNNIDTLDINKILMAVEEKENTLFDSLENAGVCLHINSNRVSLEYCSACHYNSLN